MPSTTAYGWLPARAASASARARIANEAIADILAHVFDGDACHGKVLDEQGTPVGCRRRMDVYERSVSDAVWQFGRADHESGQALRQLIWTLRAEVAPDALRVAIRDGTAAVQLALNQIDQEPLANVPVFDDEILAVWPTSCANMRRAARSSTRSATAWAMHRSPAASTSAHRRPSPRDAETWLANFAHGDRRERRHAGRWPPGCVPARWSAHPADGRHAAGWRTGNLCGRPPLGHPQIESESTSGGVTLWFSAPASAAPGARSWAGPLTAS
jgi:hypothetical protein